MTTTAISARAIYEQVGAELAGASVRMGTMFGMPVLKLGKRALGGLYGEAMVFKLPLDSDSHRAALAHDGASQFAPLDGRRVMREWIVVPVAYAAHWPAYARAALAYVAESA